MSDSEEAEAAVRTGRILLVADDEAHAELIRRAFDATGMMWEIHRVANLRDAVDWLAANTMPFVVLADYSLPDGTGLDLAKNAMCADEVGFPLIIMRASAQRKWRLIRSNPGLWISC